MDTGPNRPQLKSILDQNSLDEFMQLAEMSQKKFEAERSSQQVIGGNAIIPTMESQGLIDKFVGSQEGKYRPIHTPLKIPRRPEWNKDMSAIEINSNENQAFLEWRRDVATMEESNVKLAITPFEKNIEVWKQLWRVIEKSDLLLQIVDARIPHFFYSEDLEKYISEVGENK